MPRTMMPDGAAEDRSNQLAILNGIAHSLLTAPEIPISWTRPNRAETP